MSTTATPVVFTDLILKSVASLYSHLIQGFGVVYDNFNKAFGSSRLPIEIQFDLLSPDAVIIDDKRYQEIEQLPDDLHRLEGNNYTIVSTKFKYALLLIDGEEDQRIRVEELARQLRILFDKCFDAQTEQDNEEIPESATNTVVQQEPQDAPAQASDPNAIDILADQVQNDMQDTTKTIQSENKDEVQEEPIEPQPEVAPEVNVETEEPQPPSEQDAQAKPVDVMDALDKVQDEIKPSSEPKLDAISVLENQNGLGV